SNIVTGFGGQLNLDEFDHVSAPLGPLRFQFIDVRFQGVNPVGLSAYLATCTSRNNQLTLRYLLNPGGDAFVVTGVMESNSVGVQPMDASGRPLLLDLPRFQAAIAGNVTLSSELTQITLRGETTATFAFSCQRLNRAATGWSLSEPILI